MSDTNDESERLRDARGDGVLLPRERPGYYPGFSTLAQQRYWDPATRDVVLERVAVTPPIRYFDADAIRFWTIVFEHLVPQSDRTPERRIPILNVVDQRLEENRSVGYRFEDMPPDREAYALGHRAIDDEARAAFGRAFVDLPYGKRETILERIHDADPHASQEIWQRMSVHRFWQLILGDAVDAYYAHPWSWDEIGFGGPAYPRAYTRLERGEPEPWEVRERRYAWGAPSDARSHLTENTTEFHTEAEQHRSHRKAGA